MMLCFQQFFNRTCLLDVKVEYQVVDEGVKKRVYVQQAEVPGVACGM